MLGEAGRELIAWKCPGASAKSRGHWEPAHSDINRLEHLLSPFMKRQQAPRQVYSLHEYYRQYAGFLERGKKYVCVNFFHVSHFEWALERASRNPGQAARLSARGRPEGFWRREPVLVLGGGAKFFRVEFAVDSGTFSRLSFNAAR